MTYLWRHICLAKVRASLHHAIRQKPRISFCVAYWCINAVVSCIIWWNLKQWLNINKFSFINLI